MTNSNEPPRRPARRQPTRRSTTPRTSVPSARDELERERELYSQHDPTASFMHERVQNKPAGQERGASSAFPAYAGAGTDKFTFLLDAHEGSVGVPMPEGADNGRATVEVTQPDGAPADTPVSFNFGDITYTKPGVYTYEIRESLANACGTNQSQRESSNGAAWNTPIRLGHCLPFALRGFACVGYAPSQNPTGPMGCRGSFADSPCNAWLCFRLSGITL